MLAGDKYDWKSITTNIDTKLQEPRSAHRSLLNGQRWHRESKPKLARRWVSVTTLKMKISTTSYTISQPYSLKIEKRLRSGLTPHEESSPHAQVGTQLSERPGVRAVRQVSPHIPETPGLEKILLKLSEWRGQILIKVYFQLSSSHKWKNKSKPNVDESNSVDYWYTGN